MNIEFEQSPTRQAESQILTALNSLKFLAQPHVTAAIFLLLYGIFGLMQYNQGQEQKDISTELTQTRRILQKVPQDRLVLEDRLVAAQETLLMERETFPAQQPTDVLLDSILQMATQSGIQVLNTKIIALREESIEGIRYVVSPFDVQVRGTMSQISSFLQLLEEGPLPTLLIGTINLAKGDSGFSLGVNFSIYGRAAIEDSNPPASRARELPPFEVEQGQIQVNVPYIAWDELGDNESEYSGLDYVELYYRVDGAAEYSRHTTPANPGGRWTETPIPFAVPSGKILELYTIAVDQAGNKEEVPAIGADIITNIRVNP